MIRIKRIDHVAIAVENIDDAAARYREVLGLEAQGREHVEAQKTDVALLPLGDTQMELISPGPGNTGLEKFLQKRGPGLHHVALEVEGLDEALATLKALGVPLVDESPRPGARGHRVAFLHPRATGGVLVELVEHASEGAPHATGSAPGAGAGR